MLRIIYASRARARFEEAGLVDLLTESRANNDRDGITGLLLYAQRSFLQVLEGPVEAVDTCYGKIVGDERHEGIRRLAREPLEERVFPDWSMGFEHPDEAELAHVLPGFRPASSFPLVAGDLVPNAAVAMTLLELYRTPRVA